LFVHNPGGTLSPANVLLVADFTGDGRVDLLVGLDDDGDPGQSWTYTGLGGARFDATPEEAFDLNKAVESGFDQLGATRSAHAFDFDANGFADVVVGSITRAQPETSQIQLFMVDAGGFTQPRQVGPSLSKAFGERIALPPPP